MLAVHVLAVLAVLGAGALGVWQYGAWQNGREDQAAALVDAAPRALSSVLSPDQAFPGASVGRPVDLAGRWLPESTLYVDGREAHGRSGVWAVTPVAVCPPADRTACSSASAMLVVRGWAPSVADAPRPPRGAVRVTGWLQPGEGSGVVDQNPGDDVLPQLRIADAIQHVDRDLYGGYVIARKVSGSGPEGGLDPVTPASLPQPTTFTSLRNLLYALEWWVFGGFAAYVWWRWCRDELVQAREVPSGA